MSAAIFHILSLCLLLAGRVFLPALNGLDLPAGSAEKEHGPRSESYATFLEEGKIGQEQSPLLLNNQGEQVLQEEVRPGFKGDGMADRVKSYAFTSAVLLREKLMENALRAFCELVPIYLKILSLRL